MMWVKRLIPWFIRSWPVLAVVLVFALGVLGGRAWFPRIVTIQVDREILRIVERLLPGEKVTIYRDVPGQTVVVQVPVTVEKIVPGPGVPGPERIVTVTVPVNVPVETILEKWPQAITVRVGGVLVDLQGVPSWATPVHQNLTIGQVAQGVYAVSSQMPGWKIETVTTSTPITSVQVAQPLPYHLGLAFGFLDDRLYSGLSYTNRVGPGYYSAIVAYGFPGVVLGASFTLPIR